MSNLQSMVESIVVDLINARFEADVKTAELAEIYKEDPVLRAMAIPALNITNVSIDLKVAFDDKPVEKQGLSEAQNKALAEGILAVKKSLATTNTLVTKFPDGRSRTAFFKSFQKSIMSTAKTILEENSKEAGIKIGALINKSLTAQRISLKPDEREKLNKELIKLNSAISSAPKLTPKVPSIIVGSEALSKIKPELVSSIKFDVDLNEARWSEADDGLGDIRDILSDN